MALRVFYTSRQRKDLPPWRAKEVTTTCHGPKWPIPYVRDFDATGAQRRYWRSRLRTSWISVEDLKTQTFHAQTPDDTFSSCKLLASSSTRRKRSARAAAEMWTFCQLSFDIFGPTERRPNKWLMFSSWACDSSYVGLKWLMTNTSTQKNKHKQKHRSSCCCCRSPVVVTLLASGHAAVALFVLWWHCCWC